MIEDSLFRLNVPGRSTLRDDTPARDDEDEISDDGNSDQSWGATTGNDHCDYLDMKGIKTVNAQFM